MAAKKPVQLTDDHARILNQVCESCAITNGHLQKAADAGLDVADLKQQNDFHTDLASKLKRAYFPHVP